MPACPCVAIAPQCRLKAVAGAVFLCRSFEKYRQA
ncbi:hypothetical protein M703_04995 [Neisseria gonorrhoeae SK29344]|nr:hypothetical protein T556_00640 [Neisseria gonorrhoeae NG-k51.05]KLS08598.1 hypothetical protein M716_00420 [Neisseria gonorrhoeae SK32402]KLS11059.1 hypothetical protein M703_04995 [Neisseria gonorrhoeae SK29344]KLS37387.1 hypothetical protein M724_04655 [Neisseria gonorrhoeae ATL_2011_01_05]KLS58954.1 hypothetical protein M742_03605 [Neisseria gonorrhoeae NYC_2011_05_07]KLS60586.1 hypothetical protein M743_09270 [Neisseria gonorrhoeae NYC_2011_05_13]KLS67895.1 hypothetical protein M741_0